MDLWQHFLLNFLLVTLGLTEGIKDTVSVTSRVRLDRSRVGKKGQHAPQYPRHVKLSTACGCLV